MRYFLLSPTLILFSLLNTGCEVGPEVQPFEEGFIETEGQQKTKQDSIIGSDSLKILVDASHGGGTWWYPQSPLTGFEPNEHHQGKPFADLLRDKGFVVDELPRKTRISNEMMTGYQYVIRTSGFDSYCQDELIVYKDLLDRGTTLLLLTDHKRFDRVDELAEYLGLYFEGWLGGTIERFFPHPITEGVSELDYRVGSFLRRVSPGVEIDTLALLGINPVIGILKHPKSKIFFMGDVNAIETLSQPFTDNLIDWMLTEGHSGEPKIDPLVYDQQVFEATVACLDN